MPISQWIQQMQANQANIEDTQAQTQQRIMSILMQKQQMAQQENTRAILSQISPQAQMDQAQAQDQQTTDPLMQMQKDSQNMGQLAARYRGIAAKLRATPNTDLRVADDFDKRAVALDTDRRQLSNELMKETKERTANIAALAASVTDEESFEAAAPEIKKLDPSFGKKANVDRDVNGELTFGPKTAAYMKVYSKMNQSASDRVREATAIQAAQDRADKLAEDKRTHESLIAEREALTAQTQMMSGIRAEDMRARIREINAKTEDIEAKKAERQAKVNAAQAKALRPATQKEKQFAEDAVLSYDSAPFVDPQTGNRIEWDENSRDAFSSAVANRAKQVYAQRYAQDPNYSMDEAYVEAIDRLSPFVTAQSKYPKSSKIPFVGDFMQDKKLVYRRSGAGEGTQRPSEETTKTAPAATGTAMPKDANEYLKSIGM
jgi:hypothetical protein